MRPRKELIEEGIINESKIVSNTYIAKFYEDQLIKFDKLGIGKETEFGVRVTKKLIGMTEKRLKELRPLIIIRRKGTTNGTI